MNKNIVIIGLVISLILNAFLFGKLLLSQEEAKGSHYAFRIVRAKRHLSVGMSKNEIVQFIGSEPDVTSVDGDITHCTWSTAYRVGPITRLIYDPAPHGQYLEAYFDDQNRLIEVHLVET